MSVDLTNVVIVLNENGVSVFSVCSRILLVYVSLFSVKYIISMLTGQSFTSMSSRKSSYRSGYYRRSNYRSGSNSSRYRRNQNYMKKW